MTTESEGRSGETTRARADDAPPLVLVDGSNVAHSSEGGPPELSNIVAVCDKLREEGYEPVVVVDAALRHQIDDRAGYERMVDGAGQWHVAERATEPSDSGATADQLLRKYRYNTLFTDMHAKSLNFDRLWEAWRTPL